MSLVFFLLLLLLLMTMLLGQLLQPAFCFFSHSGQLIICLRLFAMCSNVMLMNLRLEQRVNYIQESSFDQKRFRSILY